MKQLEIFFRTFWLLAILLAAPTDMLAEEQADNAEKKVDLGMDSIEISLITCTPHEEIYSLYGHTALRYHDQQSGEDLLFNYGVFNFKAPHFVARFVLGMTDYELGIIPFEPFCEEYKKWGSSVYEQVLNLTSEEKFLIRRALAINYLPQNRVYRYNFFYDNCSTRPRDIVQWNLKGVLIPSKEHQEGRSYRELIHELNSGHPWSAFGIDLLLGLKADLETDYQQQEFLPLILMRHYEDSQILADGHYRPLVKERHTLVEGSRQHVEKEFPLSPLVCILLLLIITIAITVFDWKRRRCSVGYDVLLMTVTGLMGCLLFIMIFSEHPTTSINLQILVLNPLSLFFIPSVIKGKSSRYGKLMTVCLLLFFLGAFLQDYAEGMEIVALCLLIRLWIHHRNEK